MISFLIDLRKADTVWVSILIYLKYSIESNSKNYSRNLKFMGKKIKVPNSSKNTYWKYHIWNLARIYPRVNFVLFFQHVSGLLCPTLFATDIIFFYFNKNTGNLFSKFNLKLQRFTELLILNKLCLSVTKAKYSFFHKPSTRDNILLKLAMNKHIKQNRVYFRMFNFHVSTWKQKKGKQVKHIGNRTANSFALNFKGKPPKTCSQLRLG